MYARILPKENSASFMLRCFFSAFPPLPCCHCVSQCMRNHRVVAEVSQSLFRSSTLRYLWSLAPLHVAMWLRSILVEEPLFALYMRSARQPKWLMPSKQCLITPTQAEWQIWQKANGNLVRYGKKCCSCSCNWQAELARKKALWVTHKCIWLKRRQHDVNRAPMRAIII